MANSYTNVQYDRASFVLWLEVTFHSAHCGQAHSHVPFQTREVSHVCVVENPRLMGCAKQVFTVESQIDGLF